MLVDAKSAAGVNSPSKSAKSHIRYKVRLVYNISMKSKIVIASFMWDEFVVMILCLGGSSTIMDDFLGSSSWGL